MADNNQYTLDDPRFPRLDTQGVSGTELIPVVGNGQNKVLLLNDAAQYAIAKHSQAFDHTRFALTNDPRFTDERAPLSHNHLVGDISDLGSAATRDIEEFETAGTAAREVTSHEGRIDPHNQYLLKTDPSTTNARTPTGIAGGALTGTYPSPTLASVDLNAIAALNEPSGLLQKTASGAWSLISSISASIVTGLKALAFKDSISNIDVAANAAIAWGKISKTGAVAADIGAVALADAAIAQWNANRLQGISITTTAPADGQTIAFDAQSNSWKMLFNGFTVNADRWGCVPNQGASRDQAQALQWAINFAASNGGGIVVLRPGVYHLSQVLLKSDVYVMGNGTGTQLRSVPGCNLDMFVNDPNLPVLRRSGLMDLWLDGAKTGGNTAGSGIKLYQRDTGFGVQKDSAAGSNVGDQWLLFRNLRITNFAQDGISLDGAGQQATGNYNYRALLLDRVHSFKNNGNGIKLSLVTDSTIINCYSSDNLQKGIYCHNFVANLRILNSKTWWNGASDPITTGATGGIFFDTCYRCTLVNCEAQDEYQNGFYFNKCEDIVLTSCCGDNNGKLTSEFPGHQPRIGLRIDNCNSVSIEGYNATSFQTPPRQNFGIQINGGNTINLTAICRNQIVSNYQFNSVGSNLFAFINGRVVSSFQALGSRVAIPATTQTLTATSTISVTDREIAPITSAAAITLTSTPAIAAGISGQKITLFNSGTFAITIPNTGVTFQNAAARLTIPPGGVASFIFLNNSWQEAATGNEPILPWTELAYLNGYSTFAAGYAALAVRKTRDNWVEVKGYVKKSTTIGSGDVIATLPAGYRMLEYRNFRVGAQNGTTTLVNADIWIRATGEIEVWYSGMVPPTQVSLDNVRFIAEA